MLKRALLLVVVALLAAACGESSGASGNPTTLLPPTTTTTEPDESPRTTAATHQHDGIRLGVSSPWEAGKPLEQRIEQLETTIAGTQFGAVRLYHRWDEPFPAGSEQFLRDPGRNTVAVLSISTQRRDGSWVPWDEIASASPDSEIGRQISSWAYALSVWDGPPMIVTLDHEPDFYRNGGGGLPHDYIGAYRRVLSEITGAAPDVRTTWISVAYFFRPGSGDQGPDYYPGDEHVDYLGIDGFNWSNCRNDSDWRSFREIFAEFRNWAATTRPDKPVLIAEVGTVDDPEIADRKVDWLRDAADTMAGWPQLEIAIFWDNVHEEASGCDFTLDSSPQAARAFAAIAQREVFRLDG